MVKNNKIKADFMCSGIDNRCLAPCYLKSKFCETFNLKDMKCIFGYKNHSWVRLNDENKAEPTNIDNQQEN